MKKLFLLPLLLLPLLVFNACSSDDDDNGTPVSIIGTWLMSDVKGTNVQTNNQTATKAIQADIQKDLEKGGLLTFNEKNQITIPPTTEPKIVGSYELKGNKLTIKIVNETTVATMSGNTFAFDVDHTSRYEDAETIKELVPNEQGVKVSKVIATYTFTKE